MARKESQMTTGSVTETDLNVRDAVMRQLDWDPEVDASAIGVAAKDGVVTLSGYIDSYAGKVAAERAARRVRGVRGVADDIHVRPVFQRTDPDIARDATHALELRSDIPPTVQIVVENGDVTLTGKVSWRFQRFSAEETVRHIRGVRGVVNDIEIAPQAVEGDVRHRIAEALHRNADVDVRHVVVTVSDHVATLTGRVCSWLQRESAELAAASAPGITRVINEILVVPSHQPMIGLHNERE
jgi:osmotically-inducible protein OsmY